MAATAVVTPSNGGSNGTTTGTHSGTSPALQVLTMPEGHHPLQHSFVFWYMRRGKGASANSTEQQQQKKQEGNDGGEDGKDISTVNAGTTSSASSPTAAGGGSASGSGGVVPNPYESSIKQIAEVHSVEQFWNIYDYLSRPNNLPTTTDLHFFRIGVKPTWEDPQNAKGGKWLIRLKKGLASRYWEELILALLGQQISTHIKNDEINGVVISIRFSEDIISVWNKHAHDRECTEKIRDGIKKVLRLPAHVHMEYKPHQTSLADKSSFRNTTVWKGSGGRGGGGGGRGGSHHHNPRGATTGGDMEDGGITRGRSGSFGENVNLDEGSGPTPTNSRLNSLSSRRSNSWGEREPVDRGTGSNSNPGNTSTVGRTAATRPETERAWR